VELRVATIRRPAATRTMVLRVLAPNATFRLDNLGMTSGNQTELRRSRGRPYGLILCVGPTGCGKTTTLHALLDFLNKPARKIWTARTGGITQEGLRQVQVQPKIGFTFARPAGLLRADPDSSWWARCGTRRRRHRIEASLTGHSCSRPSTRTARRRRSCA